MSSLRDALTYEPVELTFGTSGLRGLVTDMTDLECYINTSGFLSFLNLDKGANIYLAGDLRDSTPRILASVVKAIEDAGHNITYGGLVPTPAIALAALDDQYPCIMVTGSHIPSDRNGIKFYEASGEVLKDDEAAIKDAVASERERIYAEDGDSSVFDTTGVFKNLTGSTLITDEGILRHYKDRYTSLFDSEFLSGKQVVVYQHSAVGRDILVELLSYFGADVISVGRSDVFVPIDTENVTPDDQAYFKQLINENPQAYAIVSTDGDSDRPFVIDEKGDFHRGDELGAVIATWLEADFAAYPISSNDSLDSYLQSKSIKFEHTKIGSPYVIVAMQKAIQDGAKRAVGWEVNGGFLIGSDLDVEGKQLSPLPTRDAFLPIFGALAQGAKSSKKVSEIFSELGSRFTQAGLIDDFPVEVSRQIIQDFSEDSEKTRERLRQFFTDDLGFSGIESINNLDGIRITFDNNQIAHLRPSGNAPQLRIYSVADSQERADEIVELCIKETGIFRAIETVITNG